MVEVVMELMVVKEVEKAVVVTANVVVARAKMAVMMPLEQQLKVGLLVVWS